MTRKTPHVDKPAELLDIMYFYKQMQPDVQPARLLKISGFKIAGLRGDFQGDLASLGHRLAWNDKLGFGLCTCGKWKGDNGWPEEMTTIQHTMHKRRAVAA